MQIVIADTKVLLFVGKRVALQKRLILCEEYKQLLVGQASNRNSRYNYLCDECGMAFASLEEYIQHYDRYHPKVIGTATT